MLLPLLRNPRIDAAETVSATQQRVMDCPKSIRQREPSEQPKTKKSPTNALKKFRKHETVNLIWLKQTVKTNTMDDEHIEHTEETIEKAERDFALNLPMLVDETARDVKILRAIAAIEKNQTEDIFFPYRPHRSHLTLTTRFGLLIYNDKIVIPEATRTTIIAMLYRGHLSALKTNQRQRSGGPVGRWPGTVKVEKKVKHFV